LKGEEIRAFFSKYSMNKLAMMGERGDPIATPQVCSKTSPWKLKKVDFKQSSTKLAVPRSVMFLMIFIVPSMGILVKRETT
jgi:hypothetical protein